MSKPLWEIYNIQVQFDQMCPERGGLFVTRWLTESFAYQPWQSMMVSHRAINWSTALWDTIIDCQDVLCRAPNQLPSYKEDMANRLQLRNFKRFNNLWT